MSEYWPNRRVLVTGGNGFLGKCVVRRLAQLGPAEIITPRKDEYDLRDGEAIHRMLDATRPNILIHLAAIVGGIGVNRERPATFFYENLMMGAQLMDACYQKGVEKLVCVGTVCSYPKHCPVPFREEDFWNGYPEETNAPYGLAKKMLVVQSEAYRKQYGFNSICLIPTNLYGPGDNFDLASSHVIPAIIRKCHEAKVAGEKEVVLWGSGRATREFLYVEDCAEGILLACERCNESAPINLGSGVDISIRDLAEMIVELMDFSGTIRWDESMPDGQPQRRLATDRALALFGFQARTPFREGLSSVIRWYQKHFANAGKSISLDERSA